VSDVLYAAHDITAKLVVIVRPPGLLDDGELAASARRVLQSGLRGASPIGFSDASLEDIFLSSLLSPPSGPSTRG
jgi:hypothetical protein